MLSVGCVLNLKCKNKDSKNFYTPVNNPLPIFRTKNDHSLICFISLGIASVRHFHINFLTTKTLTRKGKVPEADPDGGRGGSSPGQI